MKQSLSYDVAVIQWITSCHRLNNVMTTRVLTLSAGTSNVMTTSVTTMQFFVEIMSTLKKAKNLF